jgi:hypothetical protein
MQSCFKANFHSGNKQRIGPYRRFFGSCPIQQAISIKKTSGIYDRIGKGKWSSFQSHILHFVNFIQVYYFKLCEIIRHFDWSSFCYPTSNVAGPIGTKDFYSWRMRRFCFSDPVRYKLIRPYSFGFRRFLNSP